MANVRSLGMIATFELTEKEGLTGAERARRTCLAALEKGILIRPLGPTLYLMLPLIVDEGLMGETVRGVLELVAA